MCSFRWSETPRTFFRVAYRLTPSADGGAKRSVQIVHHSESFEVKEPHAKREYIAKEERSVHKALNARLKRATLSLLFSLEELLDQRVVSLTLEFGVDSLGSDEPTFFLLRGSDAEFGMLEGVGSSFSRVEDAEDVDPKRRRKKKADFSTCGGDYCDLGTPAHKGGGASFPPTCRPLTPPPP
jgi:hypothetical protein